MKNDGGPAFPHEADYIRNDSDGFDFKVEFHPGMSLRDYAAIKFAAAWIHALAERRGEGGYSDEEAAEEAVRLGLIQADAMLAERSVRDG